MNDTKKSITTKRLCLCAITDKDLDDMTALLTNAEIAKTYMVPDLKTRDEEAAMFETLKNLSYATDRFVYGIYLNGRLIGMINDVDISGTEIELGYVIHPSHKGKGYATEVLGAAIPALFALGFSTVKAGAFEENAASMRVMEKCGMRRTEHTEEVEYRGVVHHCVCYEIKNASDKPKNAM